MHSRIKKRPRQQQTKLAEKQSPVSISAVRLVSNLKYLPLPARQPSQIKDWVLKTGGNENHAQTRDSLSSEGGY